MQTWIYVHMVTKEQERGREWDIMKLSGRGEKMEEKEDNECTNKDYFRAYAISHISLCPMYMYLTTANTHNCWQALSGPSSHW